MNAGKAKLKYKCVGVAQWAWLSGRGSAVIAEHAETLGSMPSTEKQRLANTHWDCSYLFRRKYLKHPLTGKGTDITTFPP